MERRVEAWVSSDGRYVVTASSLDSEASETVSFDGRSQTAVVTDPSGNQSVTEGVTPAHFLFSGADHPGLRRTGVLDERGMSRAGVELIELTTDGRSGLPARSVTRDPKGPIMTIVMSWEPSSAPPSEPPPVGSGSPSMVEVSGSRPGLLEPGFASILASGSNSKLFYTAYGACVYAYNYRDTGTGYFYGSSSARGDCLYMDVTLWNGAATGGSGICSTIAWLGSGPTSTQYSTKGVTTNPHDLSPTCSSHAGWLSDWTLALAWKGLNTSV